MALLHLCNLIEEAAPVAPFTKWPKICKKLKLKANQFAMDGTLYQSHKDKHYLYFHLNEQIYRIKIEKVPVC